MKLIFVPQYPSRMRYQEWWFTEFEKEFSKYFKVITLGKGFLRNESKDTYSNTFSPIDESIKFELHQIKEYLNLNIQRDDILFLSDLSFPGIFPQVLYHKKPNRCFCFCHATSKNKYDYFLSNRKSKFQNETSIHKLFNKIFVATNYHKSKLKNWKNVIVTGLPKPKFTSFNLDKQYDIISVSRNCIQKRNKRTEKFVEKTFGKILSPENIHSWIDYYKFISKAKILLITSKEETFGYQILDALLNNCIPLAPNKLCFPELLPTEFLYNNLKDLEIKLRTYIKKPKKINLINQQLIDNFFENICWEIIS